jgi:hypothetical protein
MLCSASGSFSNTRFILFEDSKNFCGRKYRQWQRIAFCAQEKLDKSPLAEIS